MPRISHNWHLHVKVVGASYMLKLVGLYEKTSIAVDTGFEVRNGYDN